MRKGRVASSVALRDRRERVSSKLTPVFDLPRGRESSVHPPRRTTLFLADSPRASLDLRVFRVLGTLLPFSL